MSFRTSEYLKSFSRSGSPVTDLSRIADLLRSLGEPHRGQNFVHIAGTNGKGSTLEYMSRILIEAGYKTGQFTSPFVETYNDRIRINGCDIPDSGLDEICRKVSGKISGKDCSQFEVTLACGLEYFREENCDIVFLETGIGGTLDATNVIESPLLSVITSVSLDHTQLLGDTVPQIAAQKAGIIKDGRPVLLSADNSPETVEIVGSTALNRKSRLVIPDISRCDIISSDISGSRFTYKNQDFTINMCGKHQVCNALTAIEGALLLREQGFAVSEEDILRGLEAAKVKLRAEVLSREPLVIVDGGHNRSGIDSLVSILSTLGRPITAAVGMTFGKDAAYAGRTLSPLLDTAICADGFIENNIPANELKNYFSCPCETAGYQTAVRRAVDIAKEKNTAVLICGSLYFASAARKEFMKL